MRYVYQRHTSTKVDIPDVARKETEYVFLYEIVSRIEKCLIPHSMVINFNQTLFKIFMCGKRTLTKTNSSTVTIAATAGKRSIARTFSITLSGEFLPMQLIYWEKSLSRYKFREGFSLSANEKRFSNRVEVAKFLDKIIVPDVKKETESKSSSSDQKALVIFDVFKGQMTNEVLKILAKNLILITTVQANTTKYYQALDLTASRYATKFLAKHFSEWCTAQISKELEDGKALEEVEVKLRLSVLQPLHAEWLMSLYNKFTSSESKKIINGEWRTCRIIDEIKIYLSKLPLLDLFQDIDPMVQGKLEILSPSIGKSFSPLLHGSRNECIVNDFDGGEDDNDDELAKR